MLDPVTASMSRELAETLDALKADDDLQSRIDVLRSKANQGTLSSEEDAEYKDFIDALDVISILQSKASPCSSGKLRDGILPSRASSTPFSLLL